MPGSKGRSTYGSKLRHKGNHVRGKLQLVDNQVNARSGTVRARAVFDNKDGVLMPGQSYQYTFTAPGEYFYNDPVFPQNTGKIVVR